jgi:hypothetical protein
MNSAVQSEGFHPAVRVVVDTKPLVRLGTDGLTARQVAAESRSQGYWPFRLCYEAGLREHLAASGQAKFRFSIANTGKVSHVRRLSADLTPGLVDCLRKAVYQWRFAPRPRRRVDVDLSIKLWPGDVPVVPLPTGSVSIAPAAAEAFLLTLPLVQACYEPGLSRDPRLWGRIELALQLDDQGQIRQANEVTQFGDVHVVECITSALRGALTLDAFRGEWLHVAYRLGDDPRRI